MSPGEAPPTSDHAAERRVPAASAAPCRSAGLAPASLAALPSLEAAIAAVDAAYPFAAHPYLAWMDLPATQRDAFRASQVPFRFAVEGFSRALAATLARMPELEERLALYRNVAEEHGHGSAAASHKHTYLDYLRALGATQEELAAPASAGVLAFEQALLAWCLTHGAEAGAAALGAIEHAYVGVSAAIARTIHARAWVARGSQRHYEVHEELDVVHARDLFAIAAPAWAEPRTRADVALGLALGAHWFWTLYDDLLPG